jgi:serine/threonine-protein kinase
MIKGPWLFILALTLLASARAGAQQVAPAEKAAAEALFDRGLVALREGKLQEACVRLEQSNAIERGIGTMLYLAECYEKSGRTASAWALFREAASEAQAAGQIDRATQGRQRAERIEPTLARLTIEVPEANRVPGLEVLRNGITVPAGLWSLALPVDPGEHQIEARAAGYSSYTQTVAVEKGPGTSRLHIPKLAPAPVAAISTPEVDATLDATPPSGGTLPPAPTPAPPPERGMSTAQIVGLSVAGAGAVLLVVGTAYGIRAIKKNNQAEESCTGTQCRTEAGFESSEDAWTASKVANVGVFGGGALLAGGLLTYFLAPRRETKVALSVDHRGGAIAVGGVF